MPRTAGGFAVISLALALGALSACAKRSIAAPPSAPVLDEPGAMIPEDLDLVLRLDLARLRAVLGIEGAELLAQLAKQAPVDDPDLGTARLTLSLFAHAQTAWIGVRPGLAPELTDSVVVLRGDFKGLVPDSLGGVPRWAHPIDLGGSVLYFERSAPKLRAAPSVIYLRGNDLAVIGSEAEVDALERGFKGQRGESSLRVPESGLVAAAARLQLLRKRLAARAPTVSELLEGAERLTASVDRVGESFHVRVELGFEKPEQASVVGEALTRVSRALGARGREWFSRVSIEPLGRALSLGLVLSDRELLGALRCWQSAGC
jgi:hypothetical protein